MPYVFRPRTVYKSRRSTSGVLLGAMPAVNAGFYLRVIGYGKSLGVIGSSKSLSVTGVGKSLEVTGIC